MKRYFLAVLVLLFGSTSIAQDLKSSFQRNLDFSTGGYFQFWKTERDLKVSQFTLPISFVIPLNQQLTVRVGTNSAFSSSTVGSTTTSLSGITDTRIMASYIAMDDRLLLTGGINVPTGKTELTTTEGLVVGNIGNYPYGFRVSNYGQGLTANVSGSMAFEVGGFIIGGGLGYVYKNGFIPDTNKQEYVPGNEFSISIGGEASPEFGQYDGKITVDLTYTLYGKDTYKGVDIYKSGKKIQLDVRFLLNTEKANYMFSLREKPKRDFETFSTSGGSTSEQLIENANQNQITQAIEETMYNGNQLELSAVGLFPLKNKMTLKGILEGKIYAKNEVGTGATIFGIGCGLNYKFSETLSLDGIAKFLTGTLDRKASTTITGTDIGVGIKYRIF